MADGPRYHVKFRRRREGKTNYRKRLHLLRSGSVRAVVRRTISNVTVQFIEYNTTGDKVLVSASGTELKKFGFEGSSKSTTSAYLTGLLAAKRAAKKNIEEAVLDIGMASATKGSRVFAALKGIIDAGVEIPHDDSVLPDKARIEGKHLNEKAQSSFSKARTAINAV